MCRTHKVKTMTETDPSNWVKVPSTLVGTLAGVYNTGMVPLPPQITGEGPATDLLNITSVLSSNNNGPGRLMVLNYTGKWGSKITRGYTFANTNVDAYKVQLVHELNLGSHIEEQPMEIADKMNLKVNNEEVEDTEYIGEAMLLGAHGGNLFPNIVDVNIEGYGTPDRDLKEIKQLREDCKQAVFRTEKNKVPDCPSVVEISCKREDRYGFPITVLPGDEKRPRRAILILPYQHVTNSVDGIVYTSVNSAALFLKVCVKNFSKVKLKYVDNMKETYLENPNCMRIYQVPQLWIEDLDTLTRRTG